MHYWLMKTEPESFSVEDLAAAPRRTTGWDGVRNYQARNMLRDEMQPRRPGLSLLFQLRGTGHRRHHADREGGYPDPTAFDRKHHHYDAGSDPRKPRWFMVDVQLKRRLARIITLEELRAHAAKELKGMVLLRPGNRLSVTPVEAAHWKFILSLE